ncbi:MAG: 2OG-Fe(II) oxygenase family protein [Candidatus Nanoarchaeia archaeon]|nr:2OG-Fe(II) oxygenase family protein [Candidatus Nanoarchaeia archaeon]
MLKDWINQKYLKNYSKLNKEFNKNKPFPHLILKDFFKVSKAKLLLKEVKKEKYKYKDWDLYRLYESRDFDFVKNELLKEFYKLIRSRAFLEIIKKITGSKVKTASAAAAIYKKTCYLLPHDDRLEKRKVAYILNLSEFKKQDGGQLEFFSTKNNHPIKITKSIIPKFNNLILFQVSRKSFHQVAEVLKNKERRTIPGWFYG